MDRKLLLATNNQGKIAEFRALLRPCDWQILAPADLGISLEVNETGDTYLENATLKAGTFVVESGLNALADDSGLEVDALGGRPGVHSARFGGEALTSMERVNLLLRALEDTPDGRRTARFRCVLLLAAPTGQTWQTEGVCEGLIMREPRGSSGFGYDPVFLLPELGRTMSELSAAEKNERSHRGKAARALRDILEAIAGRAAAAQ